MARIDPDRRDRQRRKRKVIVLAALGVVALGLVAKRAFPTASAAARPAAPMPASNVQERKPLVLLMPASGVEILSTTSFDPFGTPAPGPRDLASRTAPGFTVGGLLRGRVSFATINGVRRKEGERFDGVLLKRIDSGGVVLEINGREQYVEIMR